MTTPPPPPESMPAADAVTRRNLLGAGVVAAGAAGAIVLFGRSGSAAIAHTTPRPGGFAITRTDAQWRQQLTPMQYYVLRQSGTERPYSHALNTEHRRGRFVCAGCALPLFSSTTKFDSGTGWPSFYAPLPRAIGTSVDRTLGAERTEVHCTRCGGHQGHVFNDGPRPTGVRYCINGAALRFVAA